VREANVNTILSVPDRWSAICNMCCTTNSKDQKNRLNHMQRILNVLDTLQHVLYLPFGPIVALKLQFRDLDSVIPLPRRSEDENARSIAGMGRQWQGFAVMALGRWDEMQGAAWQRSREKQISPEICKQFAP
jgi:hypothetical protein